MPLPTWKPWPHEQCNQCGDDVEVQTTAPDDTAYDGDIVKCVGCKVAGCIAHESDDEDADVWINWGGE